MNLNESSKILFIVEHKETESLADAVKGYKIYLKEPVPLKDEQSILFDEVRMHDFDYLVVDSMLGERLQQQIPLKNVYNIALLYANKTVDSDWLKQFDYYFVEIKNDKRKTRKDWEKAGMVFIKWLSQSFNRSTNIRA